MISSAETLCHSEEEKKQMFIDLFHAAIEHDRADVIDLLRSDFNLSLSEFVRIQNDNNLNGFLLSQVKGSSFSRKGD